MSQLTTHILDTTTGKPADSVAVSLEQSVSGSWKKIADGVTNKDGRISNLLVSDALMDKGTYRLVFETGPYFKSQDRKTFYPKITVEFEISDDSHYHVPLLLNAYGYSTYRGS